MQISQDPGLRTRTCQLQISQPSEGVRRTRWLTGDPHDTKTLISSPFGQAFTVYLMHQQCPAPMAA
jgi:hypothetical protein